MSTYPVGLYDLLLTEAIKVAIGDRPALIEDLKDESSQRLADAFARQLSRALEDLADNDDEHIALKVELLNGLLAELRVRFTARTGREIPFSESERLTAPPRLLRALYIGATPPRPPETGLLSPWLFTAAKDSPSLLQEIRRELLSADQVDILVSFITVSGVRKLYDVLEQATSVGADGMPKVRIRILTTTYIGATEAQAVMQLARLPGCEVRISLDGRRTRLHAKAWIFRRSTGFGSAYVGSANLSGAALTGGMEWTVKLTQRSHQAVFDRAIAHFETTWNDDEFVPFDPANELHRTTLNAALLREGGHGIPDQTLFFDIQPKSYQREMLEALTLERSHGRTRNLVVAATGTGKTVVAALDYRSLCNREHSQPRLLFVAHREEILRQALRTYREVLRDNTFGELLVGGASIERGDHLFATIDSVAGRELVDTYGEGYWNCVVVDECHRIGVNRETANRFATFVQQVRPKYLLGLTATPERSDGQLVSQFFQSRPDGSPTVELRLWHALDLQLLAPFEYYACDDSTDLTDIPWGQGGEIAALSNVLSNDDVRARLVVSEWHRLAASPRNSHALVFCVSVAHAEFMAAFLCRAGLPTKCVTGETDSEERQRAPKQLKDGEICAIATVDLYNEGIDLPFVDTLLMLRPTQSPVLFQQQIGRGLRLAPKKESCLVLDFVGQHRREFRFDRLLSSITGMSRRELADAVKANSFGFLPAGCHIHLQRQTRTQVLASLQSFSSNNWSRLRNELAAFSAIRGRSVITLSEFINEQGIELSDIYRENGSSGWTTLKRAAGLISSDLSEQDLDLSKRLGGLIHVNDPKQIEALRHVAYQSALPPDRSDARALEARLQMAAYQIFPLTSQAGSQSDLFRELSANEVLRDELVQLADVLESRSTLPFRNLPEAEDTPLCLHGAYHLREIATAFGWLTPSRRPPITSGVLPLLERKIELLFVTLDKANGYHPGIAYKDYAVSPLLFHWQTQNSAAPETAGGRRYIESATNGWRFQLFVRARKSMPYRACGPVRLASYEGSRPMSIMWNLDAPLSSALFQEFSVLRAP